VEIVRKKVEHAYDAGVVHTIRGVAFAKKALAHLLRLGEMGMEHLDRVAGPLRCRPTYTAAVPPTPIKRSRIHFS
jgi:hypothetical protein